MIMNAATKMMVFPFVISFAVSYLWWVHFRVWILRQDLFAIRDRLWDQMQASGRLDDPHYLEIRSSINAMIRVAPYLSISVIATILAAEITPAKSIPGPVPAEVEDARTRALKRISRYLLFETFTGLTGFFISRIVISKQIAMNLVTKWIGRIFDSKNVREIELPGKPLPT